MSGFVDLHMHVLPAIDDGATDMAMSLEMLRRAAEGGTCIVCATPHVREPDVDRMALDDLVAKVEAAAQLEGIPVHICTGAEYQLDEWMIKLAEQKLLVPMGNSRNVLVELPSSLIPSIAWQILFEIQARGYPVMIAHPERNRDIQRDSSIADELSRKGCMLQVDAGSLTGEHGRMARKTALSLISRGLCSVVATDAHTSRGDRGSSLFEAHKRVIRRFNGATARELFSDAPRALLHK